jgi:ATP-dependent DNA helicase RecG
MPVELSMAVQYVKGVGPYRAGLLGQVGIETVEDLLKYKPLRYEDRTHFSEISSLRPDQEVVVQGKVLMAGGYSTPRKGLQIFEMLLKDETGAVSVKFFNQPYLKKVLKEGMEAILFGVPKYDSYSSGLVFQNPEFEIISGKTDPMIHTGRIVPIYTRVGKLTTRVLRQIIYNLLPLLDQDIRDPLPEELLKRWKFPGLLEALSLLHFPQTPEGKSPEELIRELNENRTPVQQRFVFEEFFLFQVGLCLIKRKREVVLKKRLIRVDDDIREKVRAILPFHPTISQKKVLKEIVDDLRSSNTMSRLLQGDVGSGKTIVALQAIVVIIENGCQAALMAPTELLAEQHYRTVERHLAALDYSVSFLTSSVKGKARKTALSLIAHGEVNLVVGTHALIEEQVAFKNLGFVVIDEQHRFGVMQRARMMQKGDLPDTLVMTATPIPRSLALTVYGDLSVSVLDELPPGRQPVRTVIKKENSRAEVYSVLRNELVKGNQIYIVYPLIEESDKFDLRGATEMAEYLQSQVFPDFKVGLMHGRLKGNEKDELMRQFSAGEINLLVSTTVIEVGIDVPNANVIVVEHAERFGLSQLHQLRGRIGRGERAGLCILMVDKVRTRGAYERLQIMRTTGDGFKIAEKDLEIRGPGEFIGTRQSGIPDFRFGNIVRDRKLLELARQEAEKYLVRFIGNRKRSANKNCEDVLQKWRERFGLYEVG